jgi:hypothetical protein
MPAGRSWHAGFHNTSQSNSAISIADTGDITGDREDLDGNVTCFVLHNQNYIPIAYPGATLTGNGFINANG